MASSSYFEPGVLITASKDFNLLLLLEQALQYSKQGSHYEAMHIFHTVCKEFPLEQSDLRLLLDALLLSCAQYQQAQHLLQQASKQFFEADSVYRSQLGSLAKHLLILSSQPQQLAQCIQDPASLARRPAKTEQQFPMLYVTCFGRFTVSRLERVLVLCSNRSGQAMLRYLIAQPHHSATTDKLMHALWPEEEMDSALHKLRIAASTLRRSLNEGCDYDGGGYLLCRNRVYQLNPDVPLQSDVTEFLTLYYAGQKVQGQVAATCYEKACLLYTGPFLSEDMYADWSALQREQLCHSYLSMCNSLASYYLETHHYANVVKWANAILKENKCDETAYRQLMHAYTAQGHRTEALRQYRRCQQILDEELGIAPASETVALAQTIQSGTFSE